jgi:hypothetical protein
METAMKLSRSPPSTTRFEDTVGAMAESSGIGVLHPPIRDNPYLAAQSGLFASIKVGIYFMAHGGKRTSLDHLIASASASFFDHRLNPRS